MPTLHVILSPTTSNQLRRSCRSCHSSSDGFQSSKMAAKSQLNRGTSHNAPNTRHPQVPTAHSAEKEKAPVLFGQADDIQPSFKLLRAASQKPYTHSPFTTQFNSHSFHVFVVL